MASSNTRRDFLRLGAAGISAVGAAPWFRAIASEPGSKAKNCILIWMIGGPPQGLLWDPKAHSTLKSIVTTAEGVRVSELLPGTAKIMKDATLIRSMSTGDSNHETARYLMHTGFRKGGGGLLHPVLGSMVSHSASESMDGLPPFLSVGRPLFVGYGAGHLGERFAPVGVERPGPMTDTKSGLSTAEFDARASFLSRMNAEFHSETQSTAVLSHQATLDAAARLMRTAKIKAFDLSAEPASLRDSYGRTGIGDSALLARRLVEAGVRFVEIRHLGWDLHRQPQFNVRRPAAEFDPAFSTLVGDLRKRGMLDDTLVICMGEFGRDPASSQSHFSRAWTTVLAGGGLNHGRAIGDTGASGGTVEGRPVSAGDFIATVCKALGIDSSDDWQSPDGRRIPKIPRDAEPVKELFA